MIEKIVLKLRTGKELELTQEEARLLFAEFQEMFETTRYIPLPIYPPVSVPSVWPPLPPVTVTKTIPEIEITWTAGSSGRQQ